MLAAAACVVLPMAALADTTAHQSAEKQCRAERTAMGTSVFKQTYGTNANRSNAFGKCVSKHAKANATIEANAQQNASQQCKAERTADPAAFAQKYGTNKNGSNAFGKCVSQKAK